MSEQRLRRKGSNRRSSKKRRRRRSSISVSSNGGVDEEEEAILRIIEHDNDDEFEINMNADSDSSKDRDEDIDSEEEERRERRRRAERRINEEILMEKINQCKELIEGVKKHTWKMSKKLDVLRKAKAYVEKFEGKLSRGQGYQQRGKELLKQLSRSWKNGMASLVPWEMKIKQIEGHFGSVVASYFVFLRWLLWISLWLTILPTCFIIIPELIAGESYGSSLRKTIPDDEVSKAYDLQTIWNAEGVVKYSLVFYGYYGNARTIGSGYRLPLAYLLTNLAAFAYSFIVVLKTMATNSRNSRMSNTDDEYTFSWKLFTEWDYMITNHDTAITKHASITTVFKETILEIKVKSRKENKWKILSIRITCNIAIVLLLALSTYVIQLSVERSRQMEIRQRNDPSYEPGVWEENELTVVMTLISMIFPAFLDIIALIEKYHPRTSLQLMLGRIFVLNLLNLYTLFIALYNKQQDLLASISGLQSNVTVQNNCSSTFQITTVAPIATTMSLSDLHSDDTTVATIYNITNRACVNVTDIPLKVKEFCWETMIGQEVFKLTVLDMVALIAQHLVVDVLRTYFVRYCNNLCCWDIEKNTPEYPEFKTAENILHLISNQGTVWLGVLFCPGLALLNFIKLYILVYFRCWTVLCYNVPEERIFRASRSNNFYYALLLVMLFLCMLPPLFAIVGIEPSPQCGPFSGQQRMFQVLTETMETELPASVNSVIQYAASPGVILPLFMLLGMTIYYLVSVGHSLRDANNELRMQLEYERTEGRKKVYAMADARHEPKGRTKGHGWGAARSSFVTKPKDMANTVLQAMHTSKGGQAKSRVHPTADESRTPSQAQKKPGQTLMDKLRAAQKLQNVPVAVIRGKQSIKANTSASRERNKIAAQSAFRSALLEYTRGQGQQNTTQQDEDSIEEASEDASQNDNVTNRQMQKLRKLLPNGHQSNPRALTSRHKEEIMVEHVQDEDFEAVEEEPRLARSSLWGKVKIKQLQGKESSGNINPFQKIQASISTQRRQVSISSKIPQSLDKSLAKSSIANKNSNSAVSKNLNGNKMPERRRRLSVSSYVDESGYLSPFSEESEDEDEDEDDEQNEENVTEIELLEESNDDHKEDSTVAHSDLNTHSTGSSPSLTELATRPNVEVKKRRGIRLPFSKLKSKHQKPQSHNLPAHTSSPPKSLSKLKKGENVSEVMTDKNKKQKASVKAPLSRILSSGSITGPVPEITVQDFSETSKQSMDADVEETPDNQNDMQEVSMSNQNQTIVEKSIRKNFDSKKSNFSAVEGTKDSPVSSNETFESGNIKKKTAKALLNKAKEKVHNVGLDSKHKNSSSKSDHENSIVQIDDQENELNDENTLSVEEDAEERGSVDPYQTEASGSEALIVAQHKIKDTHKKKPTNNRESLKEDDSNQADITQNNVDNEIPNKRQNSKLSTSKPNETKKSSQQSQHLSKSNIVTRTKKMGRTIICKPKMKIPFQNQPSPKDLPSQDTTSDSHSTRKSTLVQATVLETALQHSNETKNSKILTRMKQIGGSNILDKPSQLKKKIIQSEPGPKTIITSKPEEISDNTSQNKNEFQTENFTPEKEDKIFGNHFQNVNIFPRLKKIDRDKIPHKKPLTKPSSVKYDRKLKQSVLEANQINMVNNPLRSSKTLKRKSLDEKATGGISLQSSKSEHQTSDSEEDKDNSDSNSSQDDERKETQNEEDSDYDDYNIESVSQESSDLEINDETDKEPELEESEDLQENIKTQVTKSSVHPDVKHKVKGSDTNQHVNPSGKSKPPTKVTRQLYFTSDKTVLKKVSRNSTGIENDTEMETQEDTVDLDEDISDNDLSQEDNSSQEAEDDSENEDYGLVNRDATPNIDIDSENSDNTSENGETKSENGKYDPENDNNASEKDIASENDNASENDDASENDVNASENNDNSSENDDNSSENDYIASENDDNASENDVNASENDVNASENDGNASENDITSETGFENDADVLENEASGSENDSCASQRVGASDKDDSQTSDNEDVVLKDQEPKTAQNAKKDSSKAKVQSRVKKKVNHSQVDVSGTEDVQKKETDTEDSMSLNNNLHTVIDIEHTDSQEDISGSESDAYSKSLNASSNFHSELGYLRRDRPSLVPVSSDDELSQSHQDYLRFIKSQEGKPRQISDFPNFPIVSPLPIQSDEILQNIIPSSPTRPFTILAITNGKLDLDVEDVVIDIADDNETDKTTEVQNSENKNVQILQQSFGFTKLLQKFQS